MFWALDTVSPLFERFFGCEGKAHCISVSTFHFTCMHFCNMCRHFFWIYELNRIPDTYLHTPILANRSAKVLRYTPFTIIQPWMTHILNFNVQCDPTDSAYSQLSYVELWIFDCVRLKIIRKKSFRNTLEFPKPMHNEQSICTIVYE